LFIKINSLCPEFIPVNPQTLDINLIYTDGHETPIACIIFDIIVPIGGTPENASAWIANLFSSII
jgi:hypothetical protein